MVTWYRATVEDGIVPVEIDLETEHFIRLKGSNRKEKKIVKGYYWYCATREEAKIAVLEYLLTKLEYASKQLHHAKTQYNEWYEI